MKKRQTVMKKIFILGIVMFGACLVCNGQVGTLQLDTFTDIVVTTIKLAEDVHTTDNGKMIVRIKENICGNNIIAYYEYEGINLTFKEYEPDIDFQLNQLIINNQKCWLFDLGESLSLHLPCRLIHVRTKDNQFVILELFFVPNMISKFNIESFAAGYIMLMLDTDGKLLKRLDHSYYNFLSKEVLIKQLNSLFKQM